MTEHAPCGNCGSIGSTIDREDSASIFHCVKCGTRGSDDALRIWVDASYHGRENGRAEGKAGGRGRMNGNSAIERGEELALWNGKVVSKDEYDARKALKDLPEVGR